MTTEQTGALGAQNTTASNTTAQSAQQPATDGVHSGSSNGAMFTQEHFNAETGKARKEGRESAVADLLKELGLTSKDQLKSTIEKVREIETANLSAAEKAEKATADALKRATDLESQLNAERQERRNDKIAAALSAAASKLHAKDTGDILLHARDKHADELKALMDEGGTIDTKKVDALLEKIKVEKSHYFGDGRASTQATAIPSNNGGRTGTGMTEAEAMKRFSANNQRTIRGR